MIYQVESLEKVFRTRHSQQTAVDHVSFEISQPGIYCLLGPNGAGKTTTLKLMLKILKPTSGMIRYNGVNIQNQDSSYLKDIGAVLEGNRNLYWNLTAYENVEYQGRLRGMRDRDIRRRALELFEKMGLSENIDKKVGYMSRGMQQKVAITAALIHSPKVLFLDEPTLGLDFVSKDSMISEVESMAQEGCTILLTTHQIDVVERLANNLIIFEKGKLTFNGHTEKLVEAYRGNDSVCICVPASEKAKAYVSTSGLDNVTTETGASLITMRTKSVDVNRVLSGLLTANIPVISISQDELPLEEVLKKFWGEHLD